MLTAAPPLLGIGYIGLVFVNVLVIRWRRRKLAQRQVRAMLEP